jgi:hypothetical protein
MSAGSAATAEKAGVQVQDAEFRRLLGFPADHDLSPRARDRMQWAREWYASRGRPWRWVRHTDRVATDGQNITIEDTTFESAPLAERFQAAAACGVALAAVSAGPEAEEEAARLWKDGQADKYFFLETYASAVVERLTAMTGAELCARGDREGFAVLPHYSPGYPNWDINDQQALRALLAPTLPGPIEVMWSGMLRPKKSLFAVFGLTREMDRVESLAGMVPCETCALEGCAYRRKPYRNVFRLLNDGPFQAMYPRANARPAGPRSPLDPDATYCVATRALKKWARDRLTLTRQEDGSVRAVFHHPGSTCSNMGIPLAFIYNVRLSGADDGYRILAESCLPAPDDTGHQAMCSYKSRGEEILSITDAEKPLLGHPLNDVLSWEITGTTTGCYCKGTARTRKWGMVLSTIHYALAHPEAHPVQAEEIENP